MEGKYLGREWKIQRKRKLRSGVRCEGSVGRDILWRESTPRLKNGMKERERESMKERERKYASRASLKWTISSVTLNNIQDTFLVLCCLCRSKSSLRILSGLNLFSIDTVILTKWYVCLLTESIHSFLHSSSFRLTSLPIFSHRKQ